MRHWRGWLIALAVVPVVATGLAANQFPRLPSLPHSVGIDRIDDAVAGRWLRRPSPVTTSLADAVTDAPDLDGYDPPAPLRATAIGHDANGIYHLFGGDFTLTAESYCLHAGAFAPARGDGYAYAELRGADSLPVRHVLQRSAGAPDLSQPTIQMLLWAMLSRAKLSTMSPELRRAAERLLDKRELAAMDGGAVGVIPDDVRARLTPQLPAPVQRFVDVENRVRSLASQSTATFDQWRAVAVPAGTATPQPGDRVVPSGRWSWHPDGYFVRFTPSSFLETRMDVSVPRPIGVTRDARGRITTIADRLRTLTVSYDETQPIAVSYKNAETALRAGDPPVTWTTPGRGASVAVAPRSEAAAGASVAARLTQATASARDVVTLRDLLRQWRRGVPAAGRWPTDVDAFLTQAWQADVAVRMGVAMPGADPPFDPSGLVAVPGASMTQRLGQSSRPSGPQPRCTGSDSADGVDGAIARGISADGINVGLDQISTSTTNGLEQILIRTNNHCPLPDAACTDEAIAQGRTPPGSLKGADNLIIGAVQQSGGVTRVTLRVVNVETGEIVATGLGDANGTGAAAVQQATSIAMRSVQNGFPMSNASCS
jgi:hypothetical protein